MAHFWTYIKKDAFKGWVLLPLDAFDEFVLTGSQASPVQSKRNERSHSEVILLRESLETGEDQYVLLSSREGETKIRINGDLLHAGIRLLQNRDEVVVSSGGGGLQRLYFSTEKKAMIDRLPATAGEVSCMRCYQKINPGEPVVCCSSCGAFHHESDELPCYSYTEKCGNGMCGQSTAMNDEFSWIPDYLMGRSG